MATLPSPEQEVPTEEEARPRLRRKAVSCRRVIGYTENSPEYKDPLGLEEIHPQDLTTVQRRMRAIQLAVSGWSHEMIGRVLGLSRKRVSGIIKAEVDRCERLALKGADRLRRMEEARLCEMLRCLWPGVLRGTPRAIEVALRLSESLRKLRGLDAPTKIESTIDMQVAQASPQELVAEAERLGLNLPADPALLIYKLPGEMPDTEIVPIIQSPEQIAE